MAEPLDYPPAGPLSVPLYRHQSEGPEDPQWELWIYDPDPRGHSDVRPALRIYYRRPGTGQGFVASVVMDPNRRTS